MNNIIRTPQQLADAIASSWVYGMIVVGIALVIAFGIALLINWRTDRRDHITRRVWFIIIGLLFPAGCWLYNIETIVPAIQNIGFRHQYESTNILILIISVVVYFIVGILSMFVCRRGTKWRSILPKKFQ